MKLFISTELFRVLWVASHKGAGIDARILERGYDEFAGQLFTEGIACTDREMYRRALIYTRAELAVLTGVPGKKSDKLHSQDYWTNRQAD